MQSRMRAEVSISISAQLLRKQWIGHVIDLRFDGVIQLAQRASDAAGKHRGLITSR
jgi:hypothetical protein